MAAQQLVEQGAEGVEIVRWRRRFAAQLLRAGVVGRPAARHAARQRRQPEVGQSRPAVGIEQHVRALQVAVHQPLRVGRLEGTRHLIEGARIHAIGPAAELAEVAAGQIFHRQQRQPIGAVQAQHVDGELGRQRLGALHLRLQARLDACRREPLRVDTLQCNALLELAVLGEPDLRRASLGEAANEHEAIPERAPGRQVDHRQGSARAGLRRSGGAARR
jgi:hypothetical protein